MLASSDLIIITGASQYTRTRFNADTRKSGEIYLPNELINKININHVLLGDLAEPDSFINDVRIDDVTHVINCAAIASFGNNPLIWKVNVEGTLAFGKRMAQVAGLQRLFMLERRWPVRQRPILWLMNGYCPLRMMLI